MKKSINENKPYEKYKNLGPEALTESELLAIILRTGTRDKDALQLAEEILSMGKFPRQGLLGLYDLPLKELMAVKGIGEVKAIKLKCITELSMRLSSAVAGESLVVRKPDTVAEYFMEKLRHRRTECVVLVSMDAKGQIICESRLSTGSVRASLISPREIFLEALRQEAVNILLVHNHPSGDPTPSKNDILLTRDVKEMGDKLDIPLLDHIIIGEKCYTSFKEEALI